MGDSTAPPVTSLPTEESISPSTPAAVDCSSRHGGYLDHHAPLAHPDEAGGDVLADHYGHDADEGDDEDEEDEDDEENEDDEDDDDDDDELLIHHRPRRSTHTLPNSLPHPHTHYAMVDAMGIPKSEDGESTPRSEVPSLSESSEDWHPQSHDRSSHDSDGPAESGYFSPRPIRHFQPYLPTSSTPSTEPSPSASVNASTISVNVPSHLNPDLPHNLASILSNIAERPVLPQHDSTATTVTVRPGELAYSSHSHPPPPPPAAAAAGPATATTTTNHTHSYSDFPQFPNQAYSALSQQHYPPPYSPHILRTRSSQPQNYSASLAAQSPSHDFDIESAEPGSKTVGNTPASSPGLFSPQTPPFRPYERDEDPRAYPSPYLHWSHRQIPKESHRAEIETDPVSGRKIINNYEVMDELGRGVHGKVKLARSLIDGKHVAIKIVQRYSKKKRLGKSASHEDKIKREIAILKKARHPNIVSLLEVIDDPSSKKVYIILEHVELGEVRWSTDAEEEIAVMEYRRYQREINDLPTDEAALAQDARIMRRIQNKKAREERKRWLEANRYQRDDFASPSWSFESGGTSEDDDLDLDQMSVISGTTTATIESEKQSSSPQEPAPANLDERNQQSNPMETAILVKDPFEHPPSAPLAPVEEEPRADHAFGYTGLEGTMYGSYDPESPHRRSGSKSHTPPTLCRHYRDVPENFRKAPLMSLSAARAAFRDTVLGLEYLHYQGVIHRDIKPANLLQTKDHHIKISDFGVSYLGRETSDPNGDQSESEHDQDDAIELAKTVGTPAFYAPELCQMDPNAETPAINGQIDVWALGITLYCLVYGRIPLSDDSPYVLMKMIAEEDIHISHQRLRAVDERSNSRPSSHGRYFPPIDREKRRAHELIYEGVDDDLCDLLKRLLAKDPKKRMKLIEVKHHPWILRDILDPKDWLDKTDPLRQTQGKKIEISKEDMADAVVPLTIVERARSALRKVAGFAGILSGKSTRRRAQSSATSHDNIPSSNASSSSTLSQDGRRPSLKPDELIFSAALRASRENEHPLSQSVTASPEIHDHPQFFTDGRVSRSNSPCVTDDDKEPSPAQQPTRNPRHNHHPLPRPVLSERAQSSLSASNSVKTIRQRDVSRGSLGVSQISQSVLPSTPVAMDMAGNAGLANIFGGAGRRILRSVRSRERGYHGSHGRANSKDPDRTGSLSDDPHGEPSLGLSQMHAAGHVDPPDALKDHSPAGSSTNSPGSSRTPSIASPEHLHVHTHPLMYSHAYAYAQPQTSLSRKSSLSSSASRRDISSAVSTSTATTTAAVIADADWERARDENVRRRILEEEQRVSSRPASASFARPPSSLSHCECPPSPDDDTYYQQQRDEAIRMLDAGLMDADKDIPSSLGTSPTSRPPSLPLGTSSSEEHFTSISQSTSHPSIPSVISEDSSLMASDTSDGPVKQSHYSLSGSMVSSGETIDGHANGSLRRNLPSPPRERDFTTADDYEGYAADHAVETEDDDDDDDDSGSEDDFIDITRKKSRVPPTLHRSESISNAQLARRRARRETAGAASIKTTRSGSNNTMKKVRSHEEHEPKHHDLFARDDDDDLDVVDDDDDDDNHYSHGLGHGHGVSLTVPDDC